MRLLLANPNSNATLTAQLREAIVPHLEISDTLACHTAAGGPDFIGSHATIAAARRRLEDELPMLAENHDAVLLGCFGDLGIDVLKQRLGKSVVSLWDACVAAARTHPTRIGLLTTSAFWVDEFRRLVGLHNLSEKIPSLSAIDAPLSSDPGDLVTSLRSAIAASKEQGNVDTIVLGGALLTAAAPALGPETLPLLDLIGGALSLCRHSGAILART